MGNEMAMLLSIICEIAAPTQGVTDLQRACLSEVLTAAWAEHKQQTNITKIAKILRDKPGQVDKDLGRMLYPFTKDGPYGRYFEGKANISFKKALSVIELQSLSARKELQGVVLKIFMMQISNQMMGDTRQLFQIVMDECWELLRGRQTGEFVEGLARKIRKYGGALMCGSQNLTDFIDMDGTKPGPQAVLTNSDITYIMNQKPEALSSLKSSGKWTMTDAEEQAYRSIKTVNGVYSEVAIKSPAGFAVGVFRTDPFSRILFSTNAKDRNDIDTKLAEGLTTEQAVEAVLQERRRNASKT
jgi:conjugal transfer ATP-binding protein TraC